MKQRKVPLRKCTGCQEMKDKRELIRHRAQRCRRIFSGPYRQETGPGRIYLPQYGMLGKGAEVQRPGTLLQGTCAQGRI